MQFMLLILIIKFIDVKHKHVIYSVVTPVVCMCQSLNPFLFQSAKKVWIGMEVKLKTFPSWTDGISMLFFLCIKRSHFSMTNTKKRENRKYCKARDKMPLAKLACFESTRRKVAKKTHKKECEENHYQYLTSTAPNLQPNLKPWSWCGAKKNFF